MEAATLKADSPAPIVEKTIALSDPDAMAKEFPPDSEEESADDTGSDEDDDDDEEDGDGGGSNTATEGKRQKGTAASLTAMATAAATATAAPPRRLVGRKRPLKGGSAPQRPRKRRYVDSVCTVDGARRHVVVSCVRLSSGGFRCIFTSEQRLLKGGQSVQRANAKGDKTAVSRRRDVFVLGAPAAPPDGDFPDYDVVRENFYKRGIDVCKHVSSDLIPIHSRADAGAGQPPPPSPSLQQEPSPIEEQEDAADLSETPSLS